MRFVNKNEEEHEIYKGDLVFFRGKVCLVIYRSETFVVGLLEQRQVAFPYELVDLDSGNFLIGYNSLESMSKDPEVRLLAANEDIQLHY